MMTVRFPNGQAVVYNEAMWVSRTQWGYTDLYTKKDGAWIAQVPNSCIIESRPACKVSNPLAQNIQPQLEQLAKEIRLLKRKISK